MTAEPACLCDRSHQPHRPLQLSRSLRKRLGEAAARRVPQRRSRGSRLVPLDVRQVGTPLLRRGRPALCGPRTLRITSITGRRGDL
jgi:hypothetical protein